MATKYKKLEQYTEQLQAVKDFKDKHFKIFDQYESMQLALVDLEKALKDDVRDNIKENIANDKIRVVYSPAFKTVYKLEVIDEMATPKMKKALEEAEAITRTLDKTKFDELVEKGIIPIEIKQAAFSEIEQTPRISIKEA